MREKINSSSADFHPHAVGAEEDDESTTDEDDYGEQEREMQERREALRQRGRESYAKRKEGSLSSANTTPASTHSGRLNNPLHDIEDEDDGDEEGDVFYNESMNGGGKKPPRKKRKSGAGDLAYRPSDDGSDTEEDGSYNDQKPGSAKRRVSSSRRPGGSPNGIPGMTTPPSRVKRQDTSSTANTVVSRFKEGSMRDRASAVPPQEIVGMLPTSSPARPEDEEEASMDMSTKASGLSNVQSVGSSTGTAKSADGSFTFGGLASLMPFNPFKIVKDIKESWDRQKQLHEAKERKKKALRERKKKGQLAYQEFKRAGAMQGYSGNAAAVMGANAIRRRNSSGSMRVPPPGGNYAPDYTMGGVYEQSIGRAYSTDESRPVSRASEQSGNMESKRRRSALVTSFASDVTMKGVGESFATERPYRNSGETFETGRGQNNDETQQHSSDFVTSPSEPPENFSRKSTPRSKEAAPPPPSRAPPPPPLPAAKVALNGGKFEDVKTLVKKKSKVFASTFGGRGEEGISKASSRAISKEGPTKRDIKRQERLQKKVSNLEEQLERARRELENALDTTINGSVPPLPPMPKALRREALPRLKTARDNVLSGEDTEGEETEVDETPLSPVMNGSFGGSFMAKTAEMTIMESVEETQNETPEPNGKGKVSSSGFGISMVLPKRTSKSNLGAGRGRRRVSGSGSGSVASSSLAPGLRPQSKSMADMKGIRNSPPPPETPTEKVPPMPRLVAANGNRK